MKMQRSTFERFVVFEREKIFTTGSCVDSTRHLISNKSEIPLMKGRETTKFRWKNVYYKREESYYYESLLLRRNFDHRSWTENPRTDEKNSDWNFDISDEASSRAPKTITSHDLVARYG